MPAPTSDGPEAGSAAAQSPREADPVLTGAVEIARAAAEEESGGAVGDHVDFQSEPDGAATHFFESRSAGYVGWRWAVTLATAGADTPITVSEVVLVPGPEALVSPEWVPWSSRVRPEDMSAGDLLPSSPDDPRLVPGYLDSGDPGVDEVATDLGLGRRRVLSPEGREEAAERWYAGEYGPGSDMARMAPGHCSTCGFYLPLAGALRAAFGVCANGMAPADGSVVHAEFGCGAHSEAEVDTSSTVPVAEVVYDDAPLDYEGPDRSRSSQERS